jgi:hypothetical protein
MVIILISLNNMKISQERIKNNIIERKSEKKMKKTRAPGFPRRPALYALQASYAIGLLR